MSRLLVRDNSLIVRDNKILTVQEGQAGDCPCCESPCLDLGGCCYSVETLFGNTPPVGDPTITLQWSVGVSSASCTCSDESWAYSGNETIGLVRSVSGSQISQTISYGESNCVEDRTTAIAVLRNATVWSFSFRQILPNGSFIVPLRFEKNHNGGMCCGTTMNDSDVDESTTCSSVVTSASITLTVNDNNCCRNTGGACIKGEPECPDGECEDEGI